MKELVEGRLAIDTDGLDEEIRCEMCRNPMCNGRGCDGNCKYDEKLYKKIIQAIDKRVATLPSVQPEITDEQAIDHLQKSGWMQNHDRQMYEAGLKEKLADDSGSYDALLPSAQPEQIVRDIATIIENEKDMRVMLKNARLREEEVWVD